MSYHPTDLTSTPLGRMMARRGYGVLELAEGSGVDRFTLNDYLNGRPPRGGTVHRKKNYAGESHGNTSRDITPRHMVRLCAFLKCQPEEIQHST